MNNDAVLARTLRSIPMPAIEHDPDNPPFLMSPIPVASGRVMEGAQKATVIENAKVVLTDETGIEHVVPLQYRNGNWWA